MTGYAELFRAVTAGTSQKPFTGDTADPPVDAHPVPGGPQVRALRSAGLYAVARRAGEIPPDNADVFFDAPDDPRPIINARIERILVRALDRDVLTEALLDHLDDAGYQLSPSLLVQLANSTGNRSLTPQRWRALGPVGQWYFRVRLGAQHPALRAPDSRAADADGTWPGAQGYTHEGNPAQRERWLSEAFTADPDRALAVVADDWRKHPVRDRRAIVRQLQQTPAPAASDLLEDCLDDKDQEVRHRAAKALISYPTAPHQERMRARAAGVFSVSRLRKIGVRSDVTVDDAGIRDGLEPRHPLVSLLTLTHMSVWAEQLEKASRRDVAALDPALLQALAASAITSRHSDWVVTLLDVVLPDLDADYVTHLADTHPAPIVVAALRAYCVQQHTVTMRNLLVAAAARPETAIHDAVLGALSHSLAPGICDRGTLEAIGARLPLTRLSEVRQLVDTTSDPDLQRLYAAVFDCLMIRSDCDKELP